MAVIGIITCETLELEFASLLVNDKEIEGITILENTTSRRLIQALESKGIRNMQLIPHMNSFRPETSESVDVLIRVLDLTLHGNINILRRTVASAAREMAASVDALLLGYGLCGNAFCDLEELLDIQVPVFVPMDHDQPVDDCIGLLLGGRDGYYREQCKAAGTFFLTPGWTCHWRKIFHKDFCGTSPGMLDRIFAGYSRSLLIVTPVMGEEEMRRLAEEFNKILGLRVEICQGTMEILKQAWQSCKGSLQSLKEQFAEDI